MWFDIKLMKNRHRVCNFDVFLIVTSFLRQCTLTEIPFYCIHANAATEKCNGSDFFGSFGTLHPKLPRNSTRFPFIRQRRTLFWYSSRLKTFFFILALENCASNIKALIRYLQVWCENISEYANREFSIWKINSEIFSLFQRSSRRVYQSMTMNAKSEQNAYSNQPTWPVDTETTENSVARSWL